MFDTITGAGITRNGQMPTRPHPTHSRPSKAKLRALAEALDDLRHAMRFYHDGLPSSDPNRGRLTEARDYLEAASGRLKCAV